MSPEGKVKKKIREFLVELGWWFCTPATGGYGSSGVPDFVACRPILVTEEMVGTLMGQLIGIEAKASGKLAHVTELQADQILAINFAGGHAHAIDDVSQLDEVYPHG